MDTDIRFLFVAVVEIDTEADAAPVDDEFKLGPVVFDG